MTGRESLFKFLRALVLVVPLLALDLILIAVSLFVLGLPYFWLVSEDKAPLVIRAWTAE